MKARNAPWIVTVVVSLTVAAGAAVDTSTPDVAAKRWWAHVQFLASDALEGRETGSHGFELAATYVENQFKQVGLKPAGTDGFFQNVDFHVLQPDPAQSSWELVKDNETVPVAVGKEAAINIRGVAGGPGGAGRVRRLRICRSRTGLRRVGRARSAG